MKKEIEKSHKKLKEDICSEIAQYSPISAKATKGLLKIIRKL
jgi:hypothetical protein